MKKFFACVWDKIKDLYYVVTGIETRRILWASLIFIAIEYFIFCFFSDLEADIDIIVGSMTGLGIIFGYFITHYLEIIRKRQEKKFDQYCELLKALRIFIAETDLEENERKKLANKFQDAYFGSTIFISRKVYQKLKEVAKLYSKFQKTKNESTEKQGTTLAEFREAQSSFINCLRKEFFHGRGLDFLGYDIRWKNSKKTNQNSV